MGTRSTSGVVAWELVRPHGRPFLRRQQDLVQQILTPFGTRRID
jgi:hypothetical protein